MTISSIKTSTARNSRGFSLLELAIAITIVGVLLGALLVPLATQFQARQVRETQASLDDIKEALYGFAITRGRLPCPDTDRDGAENPCDATAPVETDDVLEGFLPWRDLAVPATDAWDRIFRYAVTREFTAAAQPGMPPDVPDRLELTDLDNANISVFTRGDNPATGPQETKTLIQLAANAPAIVLSVGSNGSGGSQLDGLDLPFATGADELNNVSAIASKWPPVPVALARPFVQRILTPAVTGCSDTAEGQPFCEYDDLLIWISAPVLLNRMVQAGQLP